MERRKQKTQDFCSLHEATVCTRSAISQMRKRTPGLRMLRKRARPICASGAAYWPRKLDSRLAVTKTNDVPWDGMPDILFGYEIFERAREKIVGQKASDVYVVGHPIEGGSGDLFRTPEEFAQPLLWLAEGNEEKDCVCVLCTTEAKGRVRRLRSANEGATAGAWSIKAMSGRNRTWALLPWEALGGTCRSGGHEGVSDGHHE